MRTVWVSFDVIGRDCLEAAAASGAEIVGVATLPGPSTRAAPASARSTRSRPGSAPRSSKQRTSTPPETVAAIAALEPELIFVVGWSQLVRDPFLATARRAVYGMHPTLLPRHRGRAPIPWAILSGLAKTGVTLFEITDATADSGPIVGRVEVAIAADETAATLYDRLAMAHVELLWRSVPLILAGTAPRIEQDARHASAWPRRTPLDGIIDWETRAPYLYDWVRAQTRPYPGAFTWLGDAKVVIWRASPLELLRKPQRERSSNNVQRVPWSRAARAAFCSRRSMRKAARGRGGARVSRILVLAAHPDDEVLGMGGTIALHAAIRNDPVRIVCVTDGSSAQYPGDAEIRAQKEKRRDRPRRNSVWRIMSISTCPTCVSTPFPTSM